MRRGPSIPPSKAVEHAQTDLDVQHAIEATPGADPWHRTNSNRFKETDMDFLEYTLGFVGMLSLIAVVGVLMGVKLVREAEEHDYPRELSPEEAEVFCALESNLNFVLPAYVATDLNRQNKAA